MPARPPAERELSNSGGRIDMGAGSTSPGTIDPDDPNIDRRRPPRLRDLDRSQV